ncbi:uncharacterized protein E5676_scaffold434G00920 [Cucumis melo var. makuwa]|uniref:DUF506 domain-containing protein n=1 Tax=Cucumis melo var. makuwa TaxID=1194695 RepID=A0A5A7U4P5_CUCMM|nr:uncharacterized protein E6C27_scaffold171G005590 [Cucumis melo var. makuwa]TYK17241.1 uncharacterized protein E5676_scaffold434G00920 [Cucumis melo var. makuwa]
MPFPMKIQPIDIDVQTAREQVRTESAKPVFKSRLRRLFDRPFPSVLRISAVEKPITVGESAQFSSKDGGGGGTDLEPSSVCLDKMVQNFIEENNEKQPATVKYGRNRCNCFNGNSNDSSDDEFDVFGGFGESITSGSSGGDACDILKGLIPCTSVTERNLLADASKIVEKHNKIHKRKDDLRKIVTDALSSLGYNSSICKSKWEKSPSFPAGEYEYVDVILDGERLLIDIDFRSEFEIARSTGTYKTILQTLPYIFVGKSDRLGQIVSIVSEAARQSLKKKGMHFPPWRKAEYMLAKWLSTPTRTADSLSNASPKTEPDETKSPITPNDPLVTYTDCGEFELIFGEESTPKSPNLSTSGDSESPPSENKLPAGSAPAWQPPAIKPKSIDKGAKIVTGLASLLKEKS